MSSCSSKGSVDIIQSHEAVEVVEACSRPISICPATTNKHTLSSHHAVTMDI
jgi:hypothetical protein